MKYDGRALGGISTASPLAEGRELKYIIHTTSPCDRTSPLAEGRELKSFAQNVGQNYIASPLAKGRELKYKSNSTNIREVEVAPRGGA